MATPTLTVDRAQRDLLRSLISMDEVELDYAIKDGDRNAALQNLERANTVCALLDDLGWAADAESDVYEIAVDRARLGRWLERQKEMGEGGLKDNLRSLKEQEAGGEEQRYCGRTLEESIELSRSYVARDRRELRVIDGLLGELDKHMAVA